MSQLCCLNEVGPQIYVRLHSWKRCKLNSNGKYRSSEGNNVAVGDYITVTLHTYEHKHITECYKTKVLI